MPDFHLEKSLQGYIAGIDEAGCGPWAGPVVAGAVIFTTYEGLPNDLLKCLDDSKKMTPKRREQVFTILKEFIGSLCYVGIGQASEREIDQLNIRQAALLAMGRAITNLKKKPDHLLVDGTGQPKTEYPAQAIIKGDQRSFSIAAASVVAKVTRDRYMRNLATQYPMYGWDQNAGYGTAAHQKALRDYGITPHHRYSFAPIAALMKAS